MTVNKHTIFYTMKQLNFALLAFPLALLLGGCGNDNEKLPSAEVSITCSGATRVDNVLYVVMPNDLVIESVDVVSQRADRKAMTTNVTYSIDGTFYYTNPTPPYGVTISSVDLGLGMHYLKLTLPLLEEGCSIATATASTQIMVVASTDDVPGGVTDGETSMRMYYSYD